MVSRLSSDTRVFHCSRFHNRPGFEADNLIGKEYVQWAFRFNDGNSGETNKFKRGGSYFVGAIGDLVTYSIGVVIASVVRALKWGLIGLFFVVKAVTFAFQKFLNTLSLGYNDHKLCDPWVQRMPDTMVNSIVTLEKVVRYCLGTPMQVSLNGSREDILEGARKVMTQMGTLPLVA